MPAWECMHPSAPKRARANPRTHTHPRTPADTHAHPRTPAHTHARPRTHAHSRLDCSIRFWDPTATPHLLTAPEGGAHVRVSAGVFAPMAPEWTLTNPAYVNCLLLQTEDPPVSLAAGAGSTGPESLTLTRTRTRTLTLTLTLTRRSSR